MSESDRWHNGSWLSVARQSVQSVPALLLLLPTLVGVLLGAQPTLEQGVVVAVVAMLLAFVVWLSGARMAHVVVICSMVALGYVAALSADK